MRITSPLSPGPACFWPCSAFTARSCAGRLRRLIDNLPTSKTTGVFIGLVELKGTAETARPLASYLAAQPCVHYRWSVEEHWSRTVTETYTDSEGKTQTRTRTKAAGLRSPKAASRFLFISRTTAASFWFVRRGPRSSRADVRRDCGRADPLYYGKGPAGEVADSDHRRRFVEQAVPHHAMLYVVGQARERQTSSPRRSPATPTRRCS